MEIFNDTGECQIRPGPPKTLARCLAKGREYMYEFQNEQKNPRWVKFVNKFKSVFQRVPSKPEDFLWNIVDYARCSITVPRAGDVIKVKQIIEQQFPLVCVKNSYNSKVQVKGSGYRDLKLLIEVEFDDLQLGGVPRLQPKTKLICEVQILCQAWLENKKTTSISYKILRAQSLGNLLNDAAKYLKKKNTDVSERHKDVIEIIKNGWLNLANGVDFSNIDADKLLLTATEESWSSSGVNMLVKNLNANQEVIDTDGFTPLILAAREGADDTAKCLIQLRSNIEHRIHCERTALMMAAHNGHEGCVRILLSAGARIGVKDYQGKSALDYAKYHAHGKDTVKYNRIVKLLRGETVGLSKNSYQNHSKLEELKTAAIEGSLAEFLDIQDVPHSFMSKLLPTQEAVSSLENLLQTLWFGGNIEHKQRGTGSTPLLIAARYGTPATVNVLIQAGAAVNVRDLNGLSPLVKATRFGKNEVVRLLLKTKADVNAKFKGGMNSLLLAARYCNANIVSELLKFGANVHEKNKHGEDAYAVANRNATDRDNVLNVLQEHLGI